MRWKSFFALILALLHQTAFAGPRFVGQSVAGRPWRRIVVGSFFLHSDLNPSNAPFKLAAGVSASARLDPKMMEHGQRVLGPMQVPVYGELAFLPAESRNSPFVIDIPMDEASLQSVFKPAGNRQIRWGEGRRSFWLDPDLGSNQVACARSELWDGMAFGLFPANDPRSELARIYAVRDLAPAYLVEEGEPVSVLLEMLLELGISKDAFASRLGYTDGDAISRWKIIPAEKIGLINQQLDAVERTGLRYSDVDIAIKRANLSRRKVTVRLVAMGVTNSYETFMQMFYERNKRGRFAKSLYIPREGGRWESALHAILGDHLPYRSTP